MTGGSMPLHAHHIRLGTRQSFGLGYLSCPTVLLMVLAIVLAGCSPRGAFHELDALPASTPTQTIFVATSRQPTTDLSAFSIARSDTISFARFDVAIPPAHQIGQIEWPQKTPDPERHFMLAGSAPINGALGFQQSIRQANAGQADEIVVFVHGYNVNFAESVYRHAQIANDYGLRGQQVLFAWPSSAQPLGYAYDRDSVAHARDDLERLLTDLARNQKGKILLIAHSMGSHLVVETLRQMSIGGNRALFSRLSGVALMSPDIDIDLFLRQMERVRPVPQPFVLLVSSRDRPLRLSAALTGQTARLGSISDIRRLKDLPVTVIDLSRFEGDYGNHLTAASSPTVIALINGLMRIPQQVRERSVTYLDLAQVALTGNAQ